MKTTKLDFSKFPPGDQIILNEIYNNSKRRSKKEIDKMNAKIQANLEAEQNK
jgi:hypothetical protein